MQTQSELPGTSSPPGRKNKSGEEEIPSWKPMFEMVGEVVQGPGADETKQ